MAETGTRNDPYRKFNFMVEIDGLTSSSFLSVDGLESANDVVDYREGSEVTRLRKLPGLTKFSNITLKRGFTKNRDLWEWRKKVLDGMTERRSGAITILDDHREVVSRLTFREAWPCRWKIGGLDAMESQVLIEEIELVVEDLRLE